MNKTKCGWGKIHRSCKKKAILEMKTLLGNWTPICKYHLSIKQRNSDNNPWGALLPIKTRELKNE